MNIAIPHHLPSTPQVQKGDPKMAQAAREFEAMFLSQMFSHMFSSIKTDPYFGGGTGEEMFKSLMVDEYGKMMSRNGGIGLSHAVQSAMIEAQQKR